MHVLQTLLQPREFETEHLYLRHNDAQGQPIATDTLSDPSLETRESGIFLPEGSILSSDTFFGSFYASYWRSYTTIDDLGMIISCKGDITVSVFEDTGAGVRAILERRLSSRWKERFLLAIAGPAPKRPLTAKSRPQRIFAIIRAHSPSAVYDVSYATSAAPSAATRLSIGLCTFNQEQYFSRTLQAIGALLQNDPRVSRVYVVNQGNRFQSSAILRMLENPKITLIEQRNLGGAGGFARTIEEALRTGESTDHLLMDDDIVLDERLISRVVTFLSYAKQPLAVGAGMFDLLRPTIMYEAGAFIAEDNRLVPYCHDVNLADHAQLWHFNSPVSTDYNAWWFCTIPLGPARKIGLPAPVFIRGDDFEYGQRLARAGVPTVTLPGIGVWHEPFYAKPAGWQSYYDLRNRLIFGATYPEKVRQLSLAHVTGLMTTAILIHDYRAAELRMKAVEDFLSGPEALFERDPEALHGEVMALARAHAPEALDDETWKRRPLSPGRKAPVSMKGQIFWQLVALLRTGLGPLRKRARPVFLDVDAHPRNTAGRAYVLTNGPRTFHLAFTPKRGRMWRLMLRALRLALRYRAERTAASRAWREGISRYRAPEWWDQIWTRGAEDTQAAATGTTEQDPNG